ncbi:hypothetical protein [Arenicella xantha]|uniref:Glutamate-ammonia-ligase adenylyltransferase n=1 Tax=Arenicella xantha TaxID=644221 RepID=A0A395JGS8_9GAMM|nr:hypothetical protein [Arenicella xantha]RBP49116.1 glutamate-ammonia-ligase adenylyltransferase [Arenicella xantha]
MTDADSLILASPYLNRLQSRVSVDVSATQDGLIAGLKQIRERLNTLSQDDPDVSEQVLLQAKIDYSFLWANLELQQFGTAAQRGKLWTEFADCTIEFALRLAWQIVARKEKSVAAKVVEYEGRVPGLVVLGMGKLGGCDLNVSSDVDLVAYFDPDVLPVPDVVGKSYVCHRVLQALTRLLSQNEQTDFVWRVDWRLRPNASATTLAMSTKAARDYYFYRASPWHRLALMKARVVAGDRTLGSRFLAELSPFIWRQNLDYRALDELAEIKQRINLEHPGLRTQRQWREPIGEEIAGFNVKLGSGGIREVEFVANALQLVWGGRMHSLRQPNTVKALSALADEQRLDRNDANNLIESYQTLRRIENAIQLLGNQQSHQIPSEPVRQQQLLTLLGIAEWNQLVSQINPARRWVNDYFSELFAEQSSSHQEPIIWPEGLSAQADEIVEAWENGYYLYGVSNQVRHRLVPLTRGIASFLNENSEPNNQTASEIIVRLHDFFRSLPSGEQYFRLLAESPALLRSIVPPLLYSPPMVSLLRQSPHIIDCYVQEDWRYPDPFDGDYVLQAEGYEEQLERMRRFVNEYLYQLYLSFLQGAITVPDFQEALTRLAEQSIELAVQSVTQNMGLTESPVSIIGMGKVAMRRMSPMSDLDLIFVFDQSAADIDSASRFVSRLQTAISTPMREGILYELDTRLRPSGRSGAPTVSIESFANHHRQRAHTWEHIALVPSRVVVGNHQAEKRIENIKLEMINAERSHDQLLRDALKMWTRIADHRIGDTPMQNLNSKLRTGGLMQAEYLASCMILINGHDKQFTNGSFDAMLAECLTESGLEELPEVLQFWRIQQLWERLLGKTDQPLSSLRDVYFSRLLEHSEVGSMDELLAKKKRYSELIESSLNDLFAGLKMTRKEIDDWHEQQVIWK